MRDDGNGVPCLIRPVSRRLHTRPSKLAILGFLKNPYCGAWDVPRLANERIRAQAALISRLVVGSPANSKVALHGGEGGCIRKIHLWRTVTLDVADGLDQKIRA